MNVLEREKVTGQIVTVPKIDSPLGIHDPWDWAGSRGASAEARCDGAI